MKGRTMSELTCRECGAEMTPIMFREEEHVIDHGRLIMTGRYRTSCDYLQCEHCGNTECVDGDFMAGPWIRERR